MFILFQIMIIPVRCFTCGKVVGNKWTIYQEYIKTMAIGDALTKLGLFKFCCRRMLMSHIEIVDIVNMYSPLPTVTTVSSVPPAPSVVQSISSASPSANNDEKSDEKSQEYGGRIKFKSRLPGSKVTILAR